MTPAEYQKRALRTEVTPEFVAITQPQETPNQLARLLHAGTGLTTEVGELKEGLRKVTLEGEPLDLVNIVEEAGDLLWYLALGFSAFGRPMPTSNFYPRDATHSVQALDRCADSLVCSTGRFMDYLKKRLIYGKPIDAAKATDTLIYTHYTVDHLLAITGHTVEQAMEKNINKLLVRFPDRFTEERALNRDLDAERRALETK